MVHVGLKENDESQEPVRLKGSLVANRKLLNSAMETHKLQGLTLSPNLNGARLVVRMIPGSQYTTETKNIGKRAVLFIFQAIRWFYLLVVIPLAICLNIKLPKSVMESFIQCQ